MNWLVQGQYSHLVAGCHFTSSKFFEKVPSAQAAGLDLVLVRHSVGQIENSEDGVEYWLATSRLLPEHIATLRARADVSLIWTPRASEYPLADQIRLWPRELADRLFIQWPQSSQLRDWGWTWKELLSQQEHLWGAFPYMKWQLPTGWDAHNPEVPNELDMEPLPRDVKDGRGSSFAPEISVVIPTYNNLTALKSVVPQLMRSQVRADFEILISDDGSDDGTYEWLSAMTEKTSNLIYMRLPRPRSRQMGRSGYRAGVARNVAATLSRGRVLQFLDADILVPDSHLDEVIQLHATYDLIQGTRIQLKEHANSNRPRDYQHITAADCEPAELLWESFQSKPWEDLDNKWQFVSTFCLSMKREHFFSLGAFRRSFHKYGFEDTDLGFRAFRAGLKFYRIPKGVYHFKHLTSRSEFKNKRNLKERLLAETGKIFFVNNPDESVLRAIPKYLIPTSVWKPRWVLDDR